MHKSIALLGLVLWLAGCAENVRIVSYPPGAAVTFRGQPAGHTPVELRAPRSDMGQPMPIKVEAPGYVPYEGEVRQRVAVARIVWSVICIGIPMIFKGPIQFARQEPIVLTPASLAEDYTESRLRKLDDLRGQGLIDEETYKATRAELIRRDLLK